MEERNKKGLLFLLGLVAGAAAGYYINSDEGRKVRRQAGQRVNEFGREMEARARDQFDQLTSDVNEAVGRGKSYVNDVSSTLKSRIGSVASRSGKAFNKARAQYEADLEKAKEKIRKRIRKLEKAIESEMG